MAKRNKSIRGHKMSGCFCFHWGRNTKQKKTASSFSWWEKYQTKKTSLVPVVIILGDWCNHKKILLKRGEIRKHDFFLGAFLSSFLHPSMAKFRKKKHTKNASSLRKRSFLKLEMDKICTIKKLPFVNNSSTFRTTPTGPPITPYPWPGHLLGSGNRCDTYYQHGTNDHSRHHHHFCPFQTFPKQEVRIGGVKHLIFWQLWRDPSPFELR